MSSWEHLLGDLGFGSTTAPVAIRITSLDASEAEHLQVTYLAPFAGDEAERRGREGTETLARRISDFSWRIDPGVVRALHITAPADVLRRVQSVRVEIGAQQILFDAADLAVKWHRSTPLPYALNERTGTETTLEWRSESGQTYLNLRAPGELVRPLALRAGAIAGVCWGLCLLLIWWMRRFPAAPERRAAAEPAERGLTWLAIGFAFLAMGLILARSREPYALTQDDNFSQFLPVIIRSAEAFFQGSFPVWNPYQMSGAPTATVGTYMLTYPPTYVSYAIARWMFHDPYLTIEVFSILHLLAGYFVTFAVLRRFGLRPSLAASGALSFVLSAWFLIGGRSQCTFVPGVVWLPLLAGSVWALEQGRAGWKWALATGAVLGIYFHAGHAQMWGYGVMFFAVAAALGAAGRRIRVSHALWCVPAMCFGIAIASPLLLTQMGEMHGKRFGSFGAGVNLLGMLVPLGRWAPDNRLLCTEPEWSGQLPYAGTTFALAAFLGLGYYFYRLILCKSGRQEAQKLVGEARWLILAGFALLLSLGPDGILWPLMAHFPPFDRFRWPAKMLPFVVLYMCVGGGILLENWSAHRRPRQAHILAFATMGLILLNCYWSRASWYTFGDRPYPALDSRYAALVASGENDANSGRLITWGWYARSPATGFFHTQALNFPTVSAVFSIVGYDTFVEESPANRLAKRYLQADPVKAARAYGVRWVVWHTLFSHPVYSGNPVMSGIEAPAMTEREILLSLRRQGTLALRTGGLELYQLPDPDPFAFAAGDSRRALPVRFDMTGARVETSGLAADAGLVVNVLWRPWMRAFADGRPLSAQADDWGRVLVHLDGAAKVVRVTYSPPWAACGLAGAAMAAAGAVLGLILRWQARKEATRPGAA